MRILFAVIKDLYTFARSLFEVQAVLEAPRASAVVALGPRPAFSPLPQPVLPLALPATEAVETTELAVPLRTSIVPAAIAAPQALVHRDPTEAFDNVEGALSYATSVTEGRRNGRFVFVEAGTLHGWVLGEAIAPLSEVLPELRLGHFYDATNDETTKLRTYIGDSFHGGRAGAPLTDVEYVTYRLKERGRMIPWPQSYNRIAGTWQRKLRGVHGIRIDVAPHTGSVMEYIIDDVGYVAYVEKVAPDLKITVTGIGLTHEHQYTEQVLPHNLWRELRPVFIEVT